VTKEEETATLASSLTCVKNLLAIVCWQQTRFNDSNINLEEIVYFHEFDVLVKNY
jgi:hypothetical protein